MTIWKFRLPTRGSTVLSMPADAQVLSVQNQRGDLVMWCAVDDRKLKVRREFDVRLTGGDYDNFSNLSFIGTVQFSGGDFVAHVFEVLA